MVNQDIWRLIQRYIMDEIHPEEYHKLEYWMKQDPHNRKLVKDIQNIWENSPKNEIPVNLEEAWKRLKARRSQKTGSIFIKPTERLTIFYRVAAIFMVMVLTGYLVYQYSKGLNDTTTPYMVMEELVTGKGEKARMSFSDGTQVTLNSSSSLKFPLVFEGSKRVVYLDGEAFFKVNSSSRHPFIVHSQGAQVEVLGTEFNVRGWSDDTDVEVFVRHGKVSVHSSEHEFIEDKGVILVEGEQTSVIRGQVPSPPRKVDVRNRLVWLNGGLHFDNASMETVIRQLERRFNVQVSVADQALLDKPFSSTFQYADLDEVLTVVAATMDVGYRRIDERVEFL